MKRMDHIGVDLGLVSQAVERATAAAEIGARVARLRFGLGGATEMGPSFLATAREAVAGLTDKGLKGACSGRQRPDRGARRHGRLQRPTAGTLGSRLGGGDACGQCRRSGSRPGRFGGSSCPCQRGSDAARC